jgi:hypothetical protein
MARQVTPSRAAAASNSASMSSNVANAGRCASMLTRSFIKPMVDELAWIIPLISGGKRG